MQNENKMNACLGKNIKISFPKAYENKEKSKTLVVKGVPTEFTNEEFKQVLDLNKIKHAKAERMKSRRDGRMLRMFQIELTLFDMGGGGHDGAPKMFLTTVPKCLGGGG